LENIYVAGEVGVYIDGDGQMQLQFLRDGGKLKESDDIGFAKVDFINNKFDLG
jgi:hypothetical protein